MVSYFPILRDKHDLLLNPRRILKCLHVPCVIETPHRTLKLRREETRVLPVDDALNLQSTRVHQDVRSREIAMAEDVTLALRGLYRLPSISAVVLFDTGRREDEAVEPSLGGCNFLKLWYDHR
jgi:hypothetical protein